MEQFLVIIRGAPASGKTTIAKRFRDYSKKIVWLKVDNFKDFFSADAALEEQKDVDETALASLCHLLDKGYSVVMEKIFYDPFIIPLAIQEANKRNVKVKVFQIQCDDEILIERDSTREGVKEGCRKPMGDDIKNISHHLDQTVIKDAIILDTGRISVDECVLKINEELSN
jgi:tRNA uridine 5-carbamoylmethylation protein Kti12